MLQNLFSGKKDSTKANKIEVSRELALSHQKAMKEAGHETDIKFSAFGLALRACGKSLSDNNHSYGKMYNSGKIQVIEKRKVFAVYIPGIFD